MENSVNKVMVDKTRSVRESHEGKFRQEEKGYVTLPETRLVMVSEGFATFYVHFKYLESWIYFLYTTTMMW